MKTKSKSFTERLERIEVEREVHIPTLDGRGIARTIKVKVPAFRDPKDGEIYFDAEAVKSFLVYPGSTET